MRRTFRVITEARACKEIPGYRPCHNKPFGYVVLIEPPVVHYKTCEDVEGVGLWRYPEPKKWKQYTVGWYKFKADAVRRCQEKTAENKDYPDAPYPKDYVQRDVFGNRLTNQDVPVSVSP